jgi:hypothetical protein
MLRRTDHLHLRGGRPWSCKSLFAQTPRCGTSCNCLPPIRRPAWPRQRPSRRDKPHVSSIGLLSRCDDALWAVGQLLAVVPTSTAAAVVLSASAAAVVRLGNCTADVSCGNCIAVALHSTRRSRCPTLAHAPRRGRRSAFLLVRPARGA